MFSYGPLVRKEDETEGKQDVEMAESGVEGQRQKRCGGRKWNELRPLFLRTGLVSQATGSSFFEAERTKVCDTLMQKEGRGFWNALLFVWLWLSMDNGVAKKMLIFARDDLSVVDCLFGIWSDASSGQQGGGCR